MGAAVLDNASGCPWSSSLSNNDGPVGVDDADASETASNFFSGNNIGTEYWRNKELTLTFFGLVGRGGGGSELAGGAGISCDRALDFAFFVFLSILATFSRKHLENIVTTEVGFKRRTTGVAEPLGLLDKGSEASDSECLSK